MSALTETVPLSLPMVSVTGTGFFVPARLGFSASAFNAYRLVPLGSIRTPNPTPPTFPLNVNGPNPVPLKEPAGIVVVKVPIWRVTGSATGLIPLLFSPRVNSEVKLKGVGVWLMVKVDRKLGVEGGEGRARDEPRARQLEHHAVSCRASIECRAIEIALAVGDQTGSGIAPVAAPPVKECRTVSVPPGESLNTTPEPCAPPQHVVP